MAEVRPGRGMRWLFALLGLASAVAGVLAILHPAAALIALGIVGGSSHCSTSCSAS